MVSYLDPHFMMNAMFGDITEEEKIAFAPVTDYIMDDLQKIVDAALEVNSGHCAERRRSHPVQHAALTAACARPEVRRPGPLTRPVPRPLAEKDRGVFLSLK